MKFFFCSLLIAIVVQYITPSNASSSKKDGISRKNNQVNVNLKAIKLTESNQYPEIDNWWAQGYTGKKGVLGLIDEGLDPTHPALKGKRIILRQDDEFNHDFLNGVRSPHGTGVACIYASIDKRYKGIAYDIPVIISGPAGEETPGMDSFLKTVGTINWMLERSAVKPTVINYSMGNGRIDCKGCPEWSPLAKIIDYIVNQKKILWVNSAGNQGYVEPTFQAPFASSLTVPAENYNALTVANMDTNVLTKKQLIKTPNRAKHTIRSTSSRGPTPLGRRKPDLTAPGHDTVTCAPDPKRYHLTYDKKMHYENGFRRMGGTSAAAPHVGAAILLLQDSGIKNPIAIKALLINSADTWTDSNTDDNREETHFKRMGSEWNRTYGWGYINMQKAFEQRHDIIEDYLTSDNPEKIYKTLVEVGQKITLVHERRVGYFSDGSEWRLSHLSIELIDPKTQKIISKDDSVIDTVHQISNCIKLASDKCSSQTKPVYALIKIKLLSPTIDGAAHEPFALLLTKH